MNKLLAIAMLCFTIVLVGVATWGFYTGNLGAALSTLPFLAIVYLLLVNRRSRE